MEWGTKPPTLRQRETLPLKPASRFLQLLAHRHPSLAANSQAEILFTPFLSNKTIICSTVLPLARLRCVCLGPDSSAMDCLHVLLTLPESGSAPLIRKAGEFSLCEESITSADTPLLALTSLDSRWRTKVVVGMAGNLKRVARGVPGPGE